MAGNKLTVAASSILEVVISMVVIVIVFGIAMMIFTNVTRSSNPVKKIEAYQLIQQILIKDQDNLTYGSTTIAVNEFSVEQEINPYLQKKNLAVIHLTVYDGNKQVIAEIKKVLETDEQ